MLTFLSAVVGGGMVAEDSSVTFELREDSGSGERSAALGSAQVQLDSSFWQSSATTNDASHLQLQGGSGQEVQATATGHASSCAIQPPYRRTPYASSGIACLCIVKAYAVEKMARMCFGFRDMNFGCLLLQ